MITKSDLTTGQIPCNHTNGNGTLLDEFTKHSDTDMSDRSQIEHTVRKSEPKVSKNKVQCNGHSETYPSKLKKGINERHTMEIATSNGRTSPLQREQSSKDSGFSTPVPSTSSDSGTVTPCSNSESIEAMETTESTLAVIASTPLKTISATYSARVKPTTASNIIEHEFDDEKNDVFYFETDHAALKGNFDYQNLLKTVTLLESQRTKAINDLDRLLALEKESLNDPITFVQGLQQKVDLNIPKRLNAASLPKIQWDKYTNNVDPLNIGKHKHMTRNKKLPNHSSVTRASSTVATSTALGTSGESASGASSTIRTVSETPCRSITVVRGRVKDESKSRTFNKLWTVEEQRRLEELLITYPPEEVEARRWNKIAEALGNRTPQQVQSRVQKYFIKLAKAGLPIPGRMPNLPMYIKKGGQSSHRHRRWNNYAQPSTFMQSYVPPVYMNEEEPDDEMRSYNDFTDVSLQQSVDSDSDDDIPVELKVGEEYQELIKLKRLRREKMKEEGQARHIGFQCDRCECDPIVGTRWHCTDCPQDMSIDFCSNCFDSQFQTESHNSSHRLEQITVQNTSSTVDTDYVKFMHRDYNYLDPNYMPAS